jgi:hypothetical protein
MGFIYQEYKNEKLQKIEKIFSFSMLQMHVICFEVILQHCLLLAYYSKLYLQEKSLHIKYLLYST